MICIIDGSRSWGWKRHLTACFAWQYSNRLDRNSTAATALWKWVYFPSSSVIRMQLLLPGSPMFCEAGRTYIDFSDMLGLKSLRKTPGTSKFDIRLGDTIICMQLCPLPQTADVTEPVGVILVTRYCCSKGSEYAWHWTDKHCRKAQD